MLFEARSPIIGSVTRLSVLLCLLVAVFFTATVPVLDEESYLAITANFDPLRPYHWWRPWPPWFGGTEPDAFVYAHPPLFLQWVAFVQRLAEGLQPIRLLAGVPFVILLGWSAGRLLERTCRHPRLALAVWLSSPIVVLGLQRGLMPDLMVVALGTTAVLGWRERSIHWFQWVGGVALGLACLTKYPSLALVPVFLIHGWRTGGLRSSWRFWLAAALLWLMGEGWLAAVYGRIHLLEVLTRASEISRGTGEGRAMALLVRLAFGVSGLALLSRGARWMWAPAVLVGSAVCLWAWPEDALQWQRIVLVACAIVGAALVAVAGAGVVRGFRQGEAESDRLLMGLWALSVIGGVWGVHNFAAPRYLLGAILPISILLIIEVGDRSLGRTLVWIGAGVNVIVALALTVTEHRFFETSADLARATIVQFQPTHYTGEWAFRHEMDGAGVQFFTGSAPSGSRIAAPVHSSPGELPPGLIEVGRISADESTGLRMIAETAQIGWYAETLGALPLGWSAEPLEEVVTWRVP